jgi:hypothetical protein
MVVKAVNDTAGSDGYMPILLVFGAYPRIFADSPPSPIVTQRAEAIRKAVAKVRKLTASRNVKAALRARNGPDQTLSNTNELPLQSEVRVWREKYGWQGPYKVVSTDGQSVTLQLPNGPSTFRSTRVAPYYRVPNPDVSPSDQTNPVEGAGEPATGQVGASMIRRRGRPRKNTAPVATTYLFPKKISDYALAIKLRKDNVINIFKAPFEKSDNIEIIDLIARDIIAFERFDSTKYTGRLFKSRIIHEIKGKNDTFYEKSC